jgi:alpha-L-rhamnosidase
VDSTAVVAAVGVALVTSGGAPFTLRVTVPVGATGEVFVPVREGNGVAAPAGATFVGTRDGYAGYRVGSGTYEFRTG